MDTLIERLRQSSHFFAGSAPYVEALYERYREDPDSVPPEWHEVFKDLDGHAPAVTRPRSVRQAAPGLAPARVAPPVRAAAPETRVIAPAGPQVPGGIPAEKQSGVRQLILSYRSSGHMVANLDPIRLRETLDIDALQLGQHALSEEDLDTVFDTGNMWGPKDATLREIIHILRQTYTRQIGIEYIHINDLEQRNWIRDRLERTQSSSSFDPEFRENLLSRLAAAEGLERFLHTRYAGQKRFSLEGGESLIPMLETVIERAGSSDVREMVMGMAHRGRLNVLINIMGKTPRDLFHEFEGHYDPGEHTGDVKYHEGYSSNAETPGGPIHLALAFNPSHLEIIDPVVEGSVRARQDRRGDVAHREVMPVLIHGDAAIAGQGVVYETFNLAQTRGFSTGGTIHIVVNNQIGFTLSNPLDSRSTLYCTDIGKVVQAPIIHVNGDDPEAVVFATRLAVDFRMNFSKDVVIDLVCYRRHGHNEADEPAATQPIMYQTIRNHPTTRELYAQKLIDDGTITQEAADAMVADYRRRFEAGERVAPYVRDNLVYPHIASWTDYIGQPWDAEHITRISPLTLARLGKVLTTIPEDFELNPRVKKIMDDRRKMAAGALPMDWGCAETLAYAALLDEGYRVRLTGQDSGRGTFFHRHAVLHCQRTGSTHIPLQQLGEDASWCMVVDSILSEEAVLGFEYGYSTTVPDALVVWEAQFGDFVNGAQVVIDQFLSSSEQKWRRLCGLVLMLPHGWEGQGPEHSSARLERFLQLCAQDNIQVCSPTTPAQMFHVLRREMVRPYRKPLILMSPKSTLRRKASFSDLEDLTRHDFRLVIGETDPAVTPANVRRVVLCTGKVYYDLVEEREKRNLKEVAVLRIEQLYPFPSDALSSELAPYGAVEDFVWCQEEPRNQGAWYSIQHDIRRCLEDRQTLSYTGRRAHAAPAGGVPREHNERQKKLVDEALRLGESLNVMVPAETSASAS